MLTNPAEGLYVATDKTPTGRKLYEIFDRANSIHFYTTQRRIADRYINSLKFRRNR